MAARIRPSTIMPHLAPGLAAIYRIVNTVTGDEYVGWTTRLTSRMNGHARGIADGNHPNEVLRQAVERFGASAFVLDLLEVCTAFDGPTRERHWINVRKPKYNQPPELIEKSAE